MAPLLGVYFLTAGGEQQFFQRCALRQAFLLQQGYSLSQALQADEPTSRQEVSTGTEDPFQPDKFTITKY